MDRDGKFVKWSKIQTRTRSDDASDVVSVLNAFAYTCGAGVVAAARRRRPRRKHGSQRVLPRLTATPMLN